MQVRLALPQKLLILAAFLLSNPAQALSKDPSAALVRMTQTLHLRDEQRVAATTYLKAIASVADEEVEPLLDDGVAGSLQRVQTVRRNMKLLLHVVRKWKTATAELSKHLDADQQAVWDKLDTQMYSKDSTTGVSVDPSFRPEDYPPSQLHVSGSDPEWLIKPSEDVLARLYPSRGEKGGRAVVRCIVTTAGYLRECNVASEEPRGRGFGNAALIATAYARFAPARSFGAPVEASVDYPVSFGEDHTESALNFHAVSLSGAAAKAPKGRNAP